MCATHLTTCLQTDLAT